MHTVLWKPSAMTDLVEIWMRADSADRRAISNACNHIDRDLSRDPQEKGESRSSGQRIILVAPLGVIFRVSEMDRIASVLHVWKFRTKQVD